MSNLPIEIQIEEIKKLLNIVAEKLEIDYHFCDICGKLINNDQGYNTKFDHFSYETQKMFETYYDYVTYCCVICKEKIQEKGEKQFS
jgi:hypothetical protein